MARGLDPAHAGSGGTSLITIGHGHPYLTHDGPLFFAHRGGSKLAPENTLAAYTHGLSLGADALELDVHLARDGELMVIHDDTLDRTTDGSGPVATRTRDDLRRFDAGYRFTSDGGQTFPFRGKGITIPTLREVLEAFPETRLNVELKENRPEGERALWQLTQEMGAEDRVLGASNHLAAIVRFRALCAGRMATSASATEIRNFVFAAMSRTARWLRPTYDALQVPETWRALRIVSPATLALAHRMGLAVHVWTVDDRAQMDRLLAWGVDGIMTDRPDTLAEALAAQTA